MPATLIFQIKISLRDATPPIWRRVVVPASFNFEELHHVIQLAMGWDNYHLFGFWDGKRGLDSLHLDPIPFGETAETWFDLPNQRDCATVRLDEVFTAVGQKLMYIYDMGDNWQHTLLVEAIGVAATEAEAAPRCLTGRRACPPEDCGGLGGYYDILDLLETKKRRPAHLKGYDPAVFSVAEANQKLAGLPAYIAGWQRG
jgi:hypothetical protein